MVRRHKKAQPESPQGTDGAESVGSDTGLEQVTPENANGPEAPRELAALDVELTGRRRGLLRTLALYASGADRKLLAYVPGEEANFTVLGTFICLTSLMSGFGAFVAVGYWLYGGPQPRLASFGAALVAALFIFCFDRAVVRAPLNAYRFPPEVLESLWNPSADTRAFAAVGEAMSRPRPFGRVKDLLSMSIAAALRVIVSICISFLVAEAMLFVIFGTEVNREVTSILQQNAANNRTTAYDAYRTQATQINSQLDQLIASRSTTVQGLSGQLSAAKIKYADAEQDVTSLTALAGDEVYGKYACATLTTSATLCTSGSPGRGPEYAQIENALTNAESAKTTASQNVSSLAGQLNDAQGAAGQTQSQNAPTITYLQTSLKQLTANYETSLAQINTNEQDSKGILIRHQALSNLAQNTDPESATVVPAAPCTGSFLLALACDAKREIWPPTPMGAYIVSVRLVLMIIDLMPIYLKLHLTLRRRRPYDQLRAAMEERYSASILDQLDERLVEIGGRLENRASSRKAGRSAAGAEIILAAEGFKRNRGLPARLRLRERRSALSSFWDTVRRGWDDRQGADLTELLAPPESLAPLSADEEDT